MREETMWRGLGRIVASVFAITILSALGAAVYAALCGLLCWALRVEDAPLRGLWVMASGAIAGFIMAIVWAIDRVVNFRSYTPLSSREERNSTGPSERIEAAAWVRHATNPGMKTNEGEIVPLISPSRLPIDLPGTNPSVTNGLSDHSEPGPVPPPERGRGRW